jgi:hypothetical protein
MANDSWRTIRQFSAESGLPEHMIRILVKEKRLPAIFVGTRAMLPFQRCMEVLEGMAEGNHAIS